jgi:hypothetical protein
MDSTPFDETATTCEQMKRNSQHSNDASSPNGALDKDLRNLLLLHLTRGPDEGLRELKGLAGGEGGRLLDGTIAWGECRGRMLGFLTRLLVRVNSFSHCEEAEPTTSLCCL